MYPGLQAKLHRLEMMRDVYPLVRQCTALLSVQVRKRFQGVLFPHPLRFYTVLLVMSPLEQIQQLHLVHDFVRILVSY